MRLAYHRDGDVAHEDGSFQPVAAVQLADEVFHFLRALPVVVDDVGRQLFFAQHVAIGFQLFAAVLPGLLVGEDGEGRAFALVFRPDDGLCRDA